MSLVQTFWERKDLHLIDQEATLSYLKLLTTNHLYGIYGLTSVSKNIKGNSSKKKKFAHQVPIRAVKLLAKKGFIIFDEPNEIVFFPGACEGQEAQIDTGLALRTTISMIKKLPFSSVAVRLWALSWFLSNIGKSKTQIVGKFHQDMFLYMKPLIEGADLNPLLTLPNLAENKIELSGLIYDEIPRTNIYLDNILSPVFEALQVNNLLFEVFAEQLIGSRLEARVPIYHKRKETFHNSISKKAFNYFVALHQDKLGYNYEKDCELEYDIRSLGWLIHDYGYDQVLESIKLYFSQEGHKYTVPDFKSSINKLSQPDNDDKSTYWKIIEDIKSRA